MHQMSNHLLPEFIKRNPLLKITCVQIRNVRILKKEGEPNIGMKNMWFHMDSFRLDHQHDFKYLLKIGAFPNIS